METAKGIVLVVFLSASLLLAGSAALQILLPKAAAATAVNGQIVFVSNRDGNSEIYAMNADGTGQKNLSNNPSFDDTPAWSPDGSKILFSTTRENDTVKIYVMNADGSDPSKLADLRGTGFDWSPDGSKIAFTDAVGDSTQIFVMNSDGTGLVQLTDTPHVGAGGPAWSPDGTKIAFNTSGFSGQEVHIMNPDGTGNIKIIESPLNPSAPAWSPDGTRLAFIAFENMMYNIFTIKADGTGARTNITHNADIVVSHLSWSPDGTKIAFGGFKDGNSGIYSANADGSGQVESLDAAGYYPDWGVHQPTDDPTAFRLHVTSTDLAGNAIAGMWTVIRSVADDSVVQSGYTPLNFTSNTGGEYIIAIQGYADRTFSAWSDGIMSNSRSLILTSNMTLTARFESGDSLRGFTSITYTGTPEQPDLTINAFSIDGSKSLRMWTIIDPQSSDESGTTYKVYANNYKDRVFDHWSDGSKDRIRTITIDKPTTLTAYYKTGISTVTFSAHYHDVDGPGTPVCDDVISGNCGPFFGTAEQSGGGLVTGTWSQHLPRGALCGSGGPIVDMTTNGATFTMTGTYTGTCDIFELGSTVTVSGECGADSEITFTIGGVENKFLGDSTCLA